MHYVLSPGIGIWHTGHSSHRPDIFPFICVDQSQALFTHWLKFYSGRQYLFKYGFVQIEQV